MQHIVCVCGYIYNVNQIYLNNNYWDHLIRRSSICQSNYNNHFNWDFLASGIVLKLGKSELWTTTYPISNYDYIWLIDSISIFKVKFQGFIIPSVLDISYIYMNLSISLGIYNPF